MATKFIDRYSGKDTGVDVVLPDDDREALAYIGEMLYGSSWRKTLAADLGISPQLMTMICNGKPLGEGGRAISRDLRAKLGEYMRQAGKREMMEHLDRMSALLIAWERFKN